MNLLKNLVPSACAGVACVLLAATAHGQTIPNPSFEADTFTVFPGYISGNGSITGWTGAPADRVGINPGGGAPFANNGAIPNGTKVAFIQSAVTGPSVLSTTITDLTPGQTYTVNFRFNARTNNPAQTPVLKIGVDNQPIVNLSTMGFIGGTTTPYRFAAFNFTAAADTALLALTNDVSGDTTILVDDFTINVSTSGWSYAQWSSDATSGVDSSKTYTHAYNLGAAADAVINGVTFRGLGGANPAVPNEFSIGGVNSVIGSDDSSAVVSSGGGSATVGRRFIYGGNSGHYIIANLVPGQEYVATFYSVAWETGMRSQTFSVGTDRMTINQDHFNNDQGIRISYRYIAPPSGTITILSTPTLAASSLHLYGFANYEVSTPSAPVVGLQPRSQVTTPGSTATFSITATGARPLSYQWLKDGNAITDATNRSLTLTGITSDNLGAYTVEVSNANGTTASSPATLTFGNIANPSFEADVFHTFPGYASANRLISGWNGALTNRIGVTPMEDWRNIAFGNNGTPPDGQQVGFVQSTAANWLSTSFHDLTAGQLYRLTFRVNGRNGYAAGIIKSAIDDQQLPTARVNAVGGTNAYRTVSVEFTPTRSNPTLWLTNDNTADTTVLLDDFRIAPIAAPSKWTTAAWSDDSTSGVDPTKFYTHAYKFGRDATDTVVNGITFKGLPGANPTVPGQFITAGFPTVFSGTDANVLTTAGGGSAALAGVFIYNTGLQTITLSNLQPGMQYVATIYSVAWEAPSYGRSATFVYGTDMKTLNQDEFGDNVGIRFSYPYTADASGVATFSMIPTDSGSTIHTYGFANYQAVDSAPVIAAQPRNAFVAAGDPATLSVALGAGSQPTFYQWRAGDVDLLDETNSSLTITGSEFGTTEYTVVVSNALGVVTSAVARVEVGLRMAEVYNTGVDNAGALLNDNDTDPHYKVIASSDPASPGPRAFVMVDNQYPIVAGTYLTNGPASKWITVNTNAIAGTFIYRTTFILDTVDPTHSQITGRWMSDNEGLDILLNGVSLGISNVAARPFGDWMSFVINSGFVAGSNTLDFVITNQPPPGFTAFRAELYGVGRPLPPAVPQIVTQPASLTVQELEDVTFAVVASGSGPLSYQWSYWGADLLNETNRTLHLARVAFDTGGEYRVKVINPEGEVLSQVAVLNVNASPIANNDYIATAQDSSVSVPVSKFLLNDEDFDGTVADVSAVSPTSANGGTVTLSGGRVTYTPAAGFTGQDQFTYTVVDNQNGKGTGTVVVTVGTTTFVSIVTPPAMSNGQFTVGFAGVPSYPYTVETATSITGPWEVLTTVYADQEGKFQVTDPNTAGAPIKFYRTMYP